MSTEEFDTDAAHIAPLSNDNIPDANQSHFCHSCETPYTGVYCTACGQKNDDYRRSLFSLIKEFLGSITAIESRIWRTWGALLFKPGKVAREYANGRRTHWSSPVRVYIAMSILLFGFLSVTQMQLISIDVDAKPIDGITKPYEELTVDDVKLVPALRFFETTHKIRERNKSRNFDLIAARLNTDDGLKLDISTDNIAENLDDRVDQAHENGELSPEDAKQARETLEKIKIFNPPPTENTRANDAVTEKGGESESNKAPEQQDPQGEQNTGKTFTFSSFDGQAYEIESWSDILLVMIKNPAEINGAFFKYLPRIMFVMMPFTMLIGAMFIRGRGNALLYDHLVHAAYIHAVAFFLILLGILLSLIFPGTMVSRFILVALLIYLPISLKRMFGRSWLKTIWTSYGVGFIYAFNMTLIMTGLLGMQIVNTVTDMGTPLSP